MVMRFFGKIFQDNAWIVLLVGFFWSVVFEWILYKHGRITYDQKKKSRIKIIENQSLKQNLAWLVIKTFFSVLLKFVTKKAQSVLNSKICHFCFNSD